MRKYISTSSLPFDRTFIYALLSQIINYYIISIPYFTNYAIGNIRSEYSNSLYFSNRQSLAVLH
nr:MAG TPA: hypothetical protein [Caudoviricetes sp.]